MYRISSRGQPAGVALPAWDLGELLTNPHRKNWLFYEMDKPASCLDSSFGTWNVRSLYRSGSLTSVTKELARYTLDSVGLQEVRWKL